MGRSSLVTRGRGRLLLNGASARRQRAAQRCGLGSGRDKLHGRVVQGRPVVEMARTVIVIRRSTDETRAQTRAASARVCVLSGAPQNAGGQGPRSASPARARSSRTSRQRHGRAIAAPKTSFPSQSGGRGQFFLPPRSALNSSRQFTAITAHRLVHSAEQRPRIPPEKHQHPFTVHAQSTSSPRSSLRVRHTICSHVRWWSPQI